MQLRKLGDNIQQEVNVLRSQLERMQKDVGSVSASDEARKEQLMQKGTEIGDQFLRLEKCASTRSGISAVFAGAQGSAMHSNPGTCL